MPEVIMPSGAKLNVTVAPFKDSRALTQAIMRSMKGLPLSNNPFDMDLAVLKDAFIEAATSPDVEVMLEKCFQRALYDGRRIEDALFNDPKIGEVARRDYGSICWAVVEANCKPFFEQALSMLKDRQVKKAGTPE